MAFTRKDGMVHIPLGLFIVILIGSGSILPLGSSSNEVNNLEEINNTQNIQLAVMNGEITNNAAQIVAIQKVNEKMLDYIFQICQMTAKINDMICT